MEARGSCCCELAPAEAKTQVEASLKGPRKGCHTFIQNMKEQKSKLQSYLVQRLKNPFQYDFIILDLDWDWIEIGWLKRGNQRAGE